jgi:uncharacterized protein YkwD
MRSLLMLALAPTLVGHGAARCAGADSPVAQSPAPLMRSAVLCLVNRQRTSRGLPALREDPRLDRSAQAWSAHLAATGQLTHGGDFAARISAAGFVWQAAGENIASGYTTPAAVVRGWMASAGHCQNILSPEFAAIGIGVRRSVWTQDFALPMGQLPPSGDLRPARGCPY